MTRADIEKVQHIFHRLKDENTRLKSENEDLRMRLDAANEELARQNAEDLEAITLANRGRENPIFQERRFRFFGLIR